MKVFVTGASGFQGGSIAKELLNDAHEVVSLKRNPNNGAPTMNGVEVVQGSLDDKESLVLAMKGAQVAVYSFPLIFDMDLARSYTENFIAAAKQEDIDLIVFNTTFHLPMEKTGFLALDMKVLMKELFDASNLNVITLVPDVYMDNLAAPWSIPIILENKIVPYPIAEGQKIPWISHSDLAKYVAKAVTKPELSGLTLPIGGNLVSGEEITSAIAQKLGVELQFVTVPTDEFEAQLKLGFGALAAREISNLYRYVAQNHSSFVNKDFDKTNRLLEVFPQSIADWVSSVNWNDQ